MDLKIKINNNNTTTLSESCKDAKTVRKVCNSKGRSAARCCTSDARLLETTSVTVASENDDRLVRVRRAATVACRAAEGDAAVELRSGDET